MNNGLKSDSSTNDSHCNKWWWQAEESYYDLLHALEHFSSRNATGPVEACDTLFKGLNLLWTSRCRLVPGAAGSSDTKAFQSLLLDVLRLHDPITVLADPEILNLASLEPPILDHDKLRRSDQYRPGRKIPDRLRKDAANRHNKFRLALDRWTADPTIENAGSAVNKLAETLYMIRSNIAHGEKTPFGPDRDKVQRDWLVCSAAKPVLDLIIELLLDRPSSRLATYGTLRPGGTNAGIFEDIQGYWFEGSVEGRILEHDGLPLLRLQYGGEPCSVSVLCSESLSGKWQELDRFEGSGYARRLAPVRLENGGLLVAQIYSSP